MKRYHRRISHGDRYARRRPFQVTALRSPTPRALPAGVTQLIDLRSAREIGNETETLYAAYQLSRFSEAGPQHPAGPQVAVRCDPLRLPSRRLICALLGLGAIRPPRACQLARFVQVHAALRGVPGQPKPQATTERRN